MRLMVRVGWLRCWVMVTEISAEMVCLIGAGDQTTWRDRCTRWAQRSGSAAGLHRAWSRILACAIEITAIHLGGN